MRSLDRPPAQDGVAVRFALVMAGTAEGGMHPQDGREGLELARAVIFRRIHLLERDDIGAQGGQNVRYPLDAGPSVNTTALVDVIGHNLHITIVDGNGRNKVRMKPLMEKFPSPVLPNSLICRSSQR